MYQVMAQKEQNENGGRMAALTKVMGEVLQLESEISSKVFDVIRTSYKSDMYEDDFNDAIDNFNTVLAEIFGGLGIEALQTDAIAR